VGLLAMERMKSFVGYDLMVPFTAGGFLYLSCVSILPGLLEEKVRRGSDRCYLVVAFVVGIAFMYGVALLEEHDHGHGHDDHQHGEQVHQHGNHQGDHHHHHQEDHHHDEI